MYKFTSMVTENAFITPYKRALFNKTPEKRKCLTYNKLQLKNISQETVQKKDMT